MDVDAPVLDFSLISLPSFITTPSTHPAMQPPPRTLSEPIVDARNPCYLPRQPADAFLAGLGLAPPRSRDAYLASFFARLLYPSAPSPSSASEAISRASSAESDASAYMHAPPPRAKRAPSLLNNNRVIRLRPAIVLGKRAYASFASDEEDVDESSVCSDFLGTLQTGWTDSILDGGAFADNLKHARRLRVEEFRAGEGSSEAVGAETSLGLAGCVAEGACMRGDLSD